MPLDEWQPIDDKKAPATTINKRIGDDCTGSDSIPRRASLNQVRATTRIAGTVSAGVELGTLLGGTYRIVRLIGSGGMGQVFEATHERLAVRYAVKVVRPDVRDHPDALPRFMREAQVTSRLRHPGIVSVVDFNTLPNGSAFLVMEYLEGEPLGKVLAHTGPMPLDRGRAGA